ncbi:hypothetical protein QMO56_25005 [Roseomonas sp. E05]|uniref:hypothetical protein n=1 Tax=Roseomonas sp. E05 TaxID=3046310 RepID=UPI0024BA4EE4|nr:hypothetical protein [Roseomonas sp. E05]MDJ0391371.1 hypothetical protein [Roseomonas sp. E05]
MTRHLKARLARLVAQQTEVPPYFVELPHEAWEREDVLQDATEAMRAWQERTGHRGPVLIGPPVCTTAEEWSARYRPAQ